MKVEGFYWDADILEKGQTELAHLNSLMSFKTLYYQQKKNKERRKKMKKKSSRATGHHT